MLEGLRRLVDVWREPDTVRATMRKADPIGAPTYYLISRHCRLVQPPAVIKTLFFQRT
jgi:hypothetical protein